MSEAGNLDQLIKQVKNAETVELYKCDSCKDIIYNSNNGYLIVGNIYTANPNSLGGLIGNNFPKSDTFAISDINKSVFCKKCFLKAIGMAVEKVEKSRKNQYMPLQECAKKEFNLPIQEHRPYTPVKPSPYLGN